MLVQKILLVLPLVLAVSAQYENQGIEYYGTSNVRNQGINQNTPQQPVNASIKPPVPPLIPVGGTRNPNYKPASTPATTPAPAPIYYQQQPVTTLQPVYYQQQPVTTLQPVYYQQQPVTTPEPVYYPQQPVTIPQPVYYPQQPVTTPEPVYYPQQPVTIPQPVYYPQQPVTTPQPVYYPQQPVTTPQLVYYPQPIIPGTGAVPNPAPGGTASPWFINDQVIGELVPNFQCDRGNGHYAIANSCDSFIECEDNLAYKLVCPDGLHFQPLAKLNEYPCAYPSEAKCPENFEKQLARSTELCPRQNGLYSMRDGECSRYIVCQEGIATIMNCPAGLVFNEELSVCDWQANVPACSNNIFSAYQCPNAPLLRNGQMSDVIYKYKYADQCKLYVACQRGQPRLLSCDPGLQFDEASQMCVPENSVVCARSIYERGEYRVWDQ